MSFQRNNRQTRILPTCVTTVTTTLVTSIYQIQQIHQTQQTQQKNQTPTKIQVHPVAGNNSSKERLRNKIAESQNQRRLRVNWSALRD